MRKAQENAIAASSSNISPSTMRMPMDDKYEATNNLLHA